MKISVIIPVYNSESTIERLLDCLHEQKFKEFETLLIDDGSTDSSFRVCNEYSKSLGLGGKKVIKKVNGGPGSARNCGLDHSGGDYICFIDADDIIFPSYLDELFSEIVDSNADLVISGLVRESKNGKLIRQSDSKTQTYNKQNALERFFIYNHWMGPVNKIFRRDIIERNNLRFNEIYKKGEDCLFSCNYLVLSEKIRYLDKCLYCYKYNENSITRSVNAKGKLLQSDMDNLKAHEEMLNLIKSMTQGIIDSYKCRYMNTYMRIFVNLKAAGTKNKALEEKSIRYIKDNVMTYLRNPLIDLKMKLAMVLFAFSPRVFARIYFTA
ncbi:glycosyltransferase family 2 protein [Faecalibaculum rodentium]|jgi:glycosyltransferase involved in cell wall biosynthesis|uniref:glycosyltransferase family 2 protein n=1 Tax=Faecalibaculum rodentium TaxID=1702221 RepID=UPI00256F5E20|nr:MULTISPECIES: glycosyltransferase family 2 protein [Bacteria]